MELEKQCVSLELAKKLKELGVKQESAYYWVFSKDYGICLVVNADNHFVMETSNGSIYQQDLHNAGMWTMDDEEERFSAFTVAELGELLKGEESHTVFVNADKGMEWLCVSSYYAKRFYAETEADARALLLIYLLENKLISLVNN